MLNLSQNTVLLSKLCRKTKSVLIGAQPILSITFKFHARRMRGAKSVQTIGFLLKPGGARCARPSKYPPTANAPSTRHPERAARRETKFWKWSKAERTKPALVQGSTKKSALPLQFKDIFSYYLGFCEKEN